MTLICLILGFYLLMQKLLKENDFYIFAQKTKQEQRNEILFYFDLENYCKFYKKAPESPLKLVVRPYKVGASGLMVQVSVWNLSYKTQLVYPISPMDYVLRFRDETGKDITFKIYYLPPTRPLIDISKLSHIEPGNCLSTNYMLPKFYQYIKKFKFKKIECKVSISCYYIVDRKKWKLSKFELSSDWVEIPLSD